MDSKTCKHCGEKHKKVRRINTKYVFPGTTGNKPLELKRQWENAVEKAGLIDFRFHDLRHTAASYLAMNGASLLNSPYFRPQNFLILSLSKSASRVKPPEHIITGDSIEAKKLPAL